MKIKIALGLLLLSVYSYSQEVVQGPFITRNDITYHQNTNEPVTEIVAEFNKNGPLQYRANFRETPR